MLPRSNFVDNFWPHLLFSLLTSKVNVAFNYDVNVVVFLAAIKRNLKIINCCFDHNVSCGGCENLIRKYESHESAHHIATRLLRSEAKPERNDKENIKICNFSRTRSFFSRLAFYLRLKNNTFRLLWTFLYNPIK